MESKLNLCLNYHDFSGTETETWMSSKYTVDFIQFKNQLDCLEDLKNRPLYSLLSTGDAKELSFCLTFDDGYKSSLYIAAELAQRGLKGTFFIIKNKSISDSRYLSIDDIKQIDSLGMEIGSHGCTHRHMNRLKKEEMINELHDSKSFLEDILSKPIHSIAFPGGHFGKREIEASLDEGYLLNRTTIIGLNYLPVRKGIVKCITITNQINQSKFNRIINLSPYIFAKLKFRELALAFPKYLDSTYNSWKY